MLMDMQLIKSRRDEVEREIQKLQAQLEEYSIELKELEITLKTLNRLSEKEEQKGTMHYRIAPKELPTIRSMIKEALMHARQLGVEGYLPKEIREYILKTYGREIGQQVNTTASRMWRDLKEIQKDETTGRFSLPQKNRVDGDMFGDNTIDPSSNNPEQGREAGPGGEA